MKREINGCEETHTKRMLAMPITDLSRLIGRKWFLSLENLAEKSGLPRGTIARAVNGGEILPRYEDKLRAYLEAL